jgi:putative membrane protein
MVKKNKGFGIYIAFGVWGLFFIGFVYTIYHNAKEFVKIFKEYDEQVESGLKNGFHLISNSLIITALFLVVILVLLVINLVRTFIKYHQLKIVKNNDSLFISRGLFAAKSTLVNPNKIQTISYSQNFFQKKMGIYNISMEQANNGKEQNENDLNDNNLDIPGCNFNERNQILEIILGQLPKPTQFFRPDVRFLNLPIFFKVIVPLAIYFVGYLNFGVLKPFYPLAILYAITALIIIYISYRRHTLMVDNNFIVKKSGVWEVSYQIIFPNKIQSITTSQYPWHKTADVGHVTLHTAASKIKYKFGNYTEIKKMVNFWLYEIEKN